MSPNIYRLFACLFFPVLLAGCVDSHAVIVRRAKLYPHKHDIKTETRPKVAGEFHCALNKNTFWDFKLVPIIAVEKTKMIKEEHWYTVTAKVKSVTVEVSLPFDMWLPEKASESVVAHEDGHIRICKYFYRNAAHHVRKCALHVLGREFVGEAKDEQAAIKLAVEAANQDILKCYREKIVEPAARASTAYDALMSDKSNKLTVSEAIEKAIGDAH